MPQFKATAVKRHQPERPRNPFLIDDIFSPRWATTVERRIWTFEATDENEVRRLFAEAKDKCGEHVYGFDLESVTPVSSESP